MLISKYPREDQWDRLLQRPVIQFSDLEAQVRDILERVRKEGEKAVLALTERFDQVRPAKLAVSQAEMEAASVQLDEDLKKAIAVASENIRKFHKAQMPAIVKTETSPGIQCWMKSLPMGSVGLYIPGGTAPLFSTVLMLGIPAAIAGCREVVLCTPPRKDGSVHPAILYAAYTTGIKKVFRCGGAQAIAAMAYGAGPIPAVDKIFGPGNQYVTMAKQLVNGEGIPIDMPAGPSEVAIMADETADPSFVAADLLSQAEHGTDSQVLLVTTSESLIETVIRELDTQADALPRKEIAREALQNGRIILLRDAGEMLGLINQYAPEHLIISTKNAFELADQITSAGSVFLGNFSPESAGDYASGTNHTLPTNGFARAWSGLSLAAFMKTITFQYLSPEGLENIAKATELMAEAEGLHAHKNAVSLRLKKIRP